MSLGVSGIETLALIIVGATVLSIAAKKLNQPTVTAYIITGLLLGSVGLGIVSTNEITVLLSELGLAFLLFLIGLEIDLKEIKEIFKPVTVIGMAQMAIIGVLMFLFSQGIGLDLVPSLFVAAATMYSSTAVVVKILADKDEASSLPGKLDIGMLLIEDLVVVLLLAIVSSGGTGVQEISLNLLKILGLVSILGGVSWISSRYFLPGLFEKIAENKHAFFIHSLGWALLFITISGKLGISKEIGAFFAGIALGQIPYSSEIRGRVRPLTDFFMAIFFVNIGLNLTSSSLIVYWKEAIIASVVLIAAKFLIIFILTDSFKFTPETSFKTAINKTQVSEFALIFGALGVSAGYISEPILGFLSIIAIVTMGASSYFITFNDPLGRKRNHLIEFLESEEKKDMETKALENHAVVVGYNMLSKNILETLETYHDDIVVIDNSRKNVRKLANSNYEFIYGDFSHSEIREAAGITKADIVVSVASNFDVNKQLLDHSKQDATKFVKSETVEEAGDLYDRGAHYVIIENILAGEKIGDTIKNYFENREKFTETIEKQNQIIRYRRREK